MGGYAVIRWLMRHEPRIIMYHRFSTQPKTHCVSSAVLDQQLTYLKKHFNVIPLSQLRICKEQGIDSPKNSLVLTVDDGYRDFYEVAYPLLIKHDLPATVFVVTGFINKELWLWPDKITWLLSEVTELQVAVNIGQEELKPQQINEKSLPVIWAKVITYLLSIEDRLKHQWIEEFALALQQDIPEFAPQEYAPCTWNELLEMQDNKIEIGGHTHTHPSLCQVSESQLQSEMKECIRFLSDRLGNRDRDFCFPNGQTSDYNDKVKAQTKLSGFKSSVTAFYDALATSDLFEMRRHTASEEWFQFYKSVNGVETFASKLLGAQSQQV